MDREQLERGIFDGKTMEHDETGISSSERAAIVTARGTSDGLVIRLDGRLDQESIRRALNDFLVSRKAFLAGNEIVLEWIGVKPERSFVDELSATLSRSFDIEVKDSRLREQPRVSVSSGEFEPVVSVVHNRDNVRDIGERESSRTVSLFDGIEALRIGEESEDDQPFESKGRFAGDTSLWDDADARVVYSTLRSGQKIETEHSVLIFGDVNSGAEVIAGGDIIVIGTLRGVAHAGAYDETGGGRVIFALKLQPTQLRIGMVISQGASETRNVPEIARVEDNLIVVEPYQSRAAWNRR